ncbi:CotH kinase family protein [uncultured Acetatifactor sp.]|uniref:CotH kinase family protein n=3 Tax=uncultured Acetatifactor sp. TaxID=1671927 RepID=UPI002638F0EE|nr:CotH kinase family protein [uncultured Acetatifactor sp.]
MGSIWPERLARMAAGGRADDRQGRRQAGQMPAQPDRTDASQCQTTAREDSAGASQCRCQPVPDNGQGGQCGCQPVQMPASARQQPGRTVRAPASADASQCERQPEQTIDRADKEQSARKGKGMISSRYAVKTACIAMAAAVLFCVLAVAFPHRLVEAVGGKGIAMEYEAELFGEDSVIQIDIQMEDGAWEEMLDNAMAEEYYSCDVTINGHELRNVGIRPKGNTSLSAIAADPDTDRYSLKLEFDHYVDGQTCLGLDKLILNNNYADATNMKEAIVYDMYRYLEADASLYNYAEISVNGTYWGVYLALEAVEDSFLLRNYGVEGGNLYKPEGMDMGGGPGMERDGFPDRSKGGQEGQNMPGEGGRPGEDGTSFGGGLPFGGEFPAGEGLPTGGEFPTGEGLPTGGDFPAGEGYPTEGGFPAREGLPAGGDFPAGEGLPGDTQGPGQGGQGGGDGSTPQQPGGMPFGGRFSMGSGGADLNYTDDDLDSYSTIWEGEVTDSGKKDHKRVVEALRNISQGRELEESLDIDNVLKYMAVHTFSVNLDSLSGNMAHNYYLYENDGKLNVIPWDYNLSFGGMGMGAGDGASGMINDAIDTPFQGTDFFDALLEDEAYLAKYHEYLRKLTEEYVSGGRFEEVYGRIRSQIDGLVETDPTAFYPYAEYDAAAGMLYRTVLLRAESIRGQLDGSIPATDQGQREDASGLIDASSIDIEAMGVFDMGGGVDYFRRSDYTGKGNQKK